MSCGDRSRLHSGVAAKRFSSTGIYPSCPAASRWARDAALEGGARGIDSLSIGVAEIVHEVAFLDAGGNGHVERHCAGKEQVTQRHGRRRPERQSPAYVERMA